MSTEMALTSTNLKPPHLPRPLSSADGSVVHRGLTFRVCHEPGAMNIGSYRGAEWLLAPVGKMFMNGMHRP